MPNGSFKGEIGPMTNSDRIPEGLSLKYSLQGHTGAIHRIAWSMDGQLLASPSRDKTIRIWDPGSGNLMRVLMGHTSWVNSVSWSPNGRWLASGSENGSIRIWDAASWQQTGTLIGHVGRIECLAWSQDGRFLASASGDRTVRIWSPPVKSSIQILPDHYQWVNGVSWSSDGQFLASGAEDNTVRIWDAQTRLLLRTLRGAAEWVTDVAWSPDSRVIASAGGRTIRLWDPMSGRQIQALEGHEDRTKCITFSSDGRLLASKSEDNSVRLWRCDTWETVAVIYESTLVEVNPESTIAFSPVAPVLATLGENDSVIRIWDVNYDLLISKPSTPVIHYLNAKVVLVGDAGVGKTSLGIRLAQNRFVLSESTHGAQFWQIPVPESQVGRGLGLSNVKPELTIWDLAGQPDYRMVHQLFLDNTDVALLLFDCSDPLDPFRGVSYWAKVLAKQAPPDCQKLLVSSRTDVSPVTVDQRKINRAIAEYGLDGYIPTSAKTGSGIDALRQRILDIIPWDRLPRTTTPHLFHAIRELVLERKAQGHVLIPIDDLRAQVGARYPSKQPGQSEVNSVVDMLQGQGLVYKLELVPSVWIVLLKPELINQYASAIIQAARSHERGIGAMSERDTITANFQIAGFRRLTPIDEKNVLESTVELLIKHDLCFRDMGLLVFPSQINVLRPDRPAERLPAEVTYRFSGSIEAIYATLVVRLSRTDHFRLEDQWCYAAEFSRDDHRLGFAVTQLEEGTGNLEVYFDPEVSDFDRVTFIRFITDHLLSRGLDIKEQIRLSCRCGKEIQNRDAISARLASGKLDIPCQYCGATVIIPRSIEERYRSDRSYPEKQQELINTAKKRAEREVQEFQADRENYTEPEIDGALHILHLSDLHIRSAAETQAYRTQLVSDLTLELQVKRLEYMIISGDVAVHSTQAEYEAAIALIDGIVKRFGLDPSRIVLVPGNHDQNWDLSAESYPLIPKHRLPNQLPDGWHIPAGEAGAAVRDDTLYQQRFAHFSAHFYKRVSGGQDYYMDCQRQGILFPGPADRVLFLALNSAWEIDHYFRDRASINMEALSRALDQSQDDQYDDWLKIAVFHHPVTGRETMNDDFMQLLAVHGFQIVLHGHVHEAKEGFYKYDDKRGIHIIGAGTFGAPTREQTPGIPLQYNLLTLNPDTRTLTVETRKKEKPGGAWMADARWGDRNNPSPRYTIQLKNWKHPVVGKP